MGTVGEECKLGRGTKSQTVKELEDSCVLREVMQVTVQHSVRPVEGEFLFQPVPSSVAASRGLLLTIQLDLYVGLLALRS